MKLNALLSIGLHEEVEVEQAVSQSSNTISRSTERALVESHLQTQRAAIKMLHERILVLVQYVTEVIAGKCHDLCATAHI